MNDKLDAVSAWIAREIIPHELSIRNWISRRWRHVIDVEDVVQEAYCRIANLETTDHIVSPKSYFLRTAHAIATDRMRRAGILNFTSLAHIDWLNVIDTEPTADRVLEASQELQWVDKLLSQLSETHRRAIELRRIDGLSRREAAEQLGVSEDALKKHVERGMRQIVKMMSAQDPENALDEQQANERKVV